jgi:two-component system, NtrC family, sensor histidine kinase HydH
MQDAVLHNARTGWTILAVTLVVVALGAVVATVLHLNERDRASLLERFRGERMQQVDEAAAEIADDFADIADDLRFAGQLVSATDSVSDRERELGALLAVVRHYHMVRVYDSNRAPVLTVLDPLHARALTKDDFADAMADTARHSSRRQPGEIETSRSLLDDESGWLRVFATPLPGDAGSIAVLVDLEPLFARLRLLPPDAGSRLVVLGAFGQAAPSTDADMRALFDPDNRSVSVELATLAKRLRDGEHGQLDLAARAVSVPGLGDDDVVASFAPVPMPGGFHWSIATLSSTAPLRAQERTLLVRVGVGAGAVVVVILVFGAYVLSTSRRAAATRERLLRADELAHLHEKTEKILDQIPAGVMVMGADGRVTSFNRALRERLPLKVLGGPIVRAFPEAGTRVSAIISELMSRATANGKVASSFGERLTLYGQEGLYSLHAVPLESSFPEARAILVIDDHSQIDMLQAQLLRAEKMATLGVLATGIAHEIGTPLGIVRARAEIVAGKLGADHALAAGVKVIVEQIDRVSRTIRQLLDFSRVKPVAVQAVDAGSVARTVAELVRFEAERRAVQVRIDLPADLPRVLADPDQLQQVLVNLVMNGCDACDIGGVVSINGRVEDGRVRIEVTDDGCGIPEEHRHQVFDPFFTSKKRGQGTGLGLTLAQQIVRSHGGDIILDSEVGRGTTVALIWPMAGATEQVHEAVV